MEDGDTHGGGEGELWVCNIAQSIGNSHIITVVAARCLRVEHEFRRLHEGLGFKHGKGEGEQSVPTVMCNIA